MKTLLPFLLTLALIGCDSEPAPESEPAAKPAPPPAAPPPPAQLNTDAMKAAAEVPGALIPSPLEVERAVRNAGVADSLGVNVPMRALAFSKDMDVDRAAILTGVLLADVTLTAQSAPAEALANRLGGVHLGMTRLGAGAGLLSTIADYQKAIASGAASRDALLEEMDAIADMMVPEEGWGPNDRSGPLVQAGSWLTGANLVASAIVKSAKPEAADALLRQPEILDYFIQYVTTKEGVQSDVLGALKSRLKTLRALMDKPTLGMEEVKVIEQTTGDIIGMI